VVAAERQYLHGHLSIASQPPPGLLHKSPPRVQVEEVAQASAERPVDAIQDAPPPIASLDRAMVRSLPVVVRGIGSFEAIPMTVPFVSRIEYASAARHAERPPQLVLLTFADRHGVVRPGAPHVLAVPIAAVSVYTGVHGERSTCKIQFEVEKVAVSMTRLMAGRGLATVHDQAVTARRIARAEVP
jgi:hypothetical protein